jgi:hypothetical protein
MTILALEVLMINYTPLKLLWIKIKSLNLKPSLRWISYIFITLDQLYVGENPKVNHISLGITVQADIHTGEKTVLQYLVKPIYNAVKTSFSER